MAAPDAKQRALDQNGKLRRGVSWKVHYRMRKSRAAEGQATPPPTRAFALNSVQKLAEKGST
jgi:hypothetical protein